MRYQSIKIQSNTQEDDFKTTPNRLKAQLSLTLVRRWRVFCHYFYLLTGACFWCISLSFKELEISPAGVVQW